MNLQDRIQEKLKGKGATLQNRIQTKVKGSSSNTESLYPWEKAERTITEQQERILNPVRPITPSSELTSSPQRLFSQDNLQRA